jgi:hypothetical protein
MESLRSPHSSALGAKQIIINTQTYGGNMKFTKVVAILFLLVVAGCAQVPKEAVDLSATVGRDIAEIRKSHIALVDIYYGGLLKNINQFIDNIYMPYQIQKTLSDNAIKLDMLSAIESASRSDATGQSQKDAFEKMKIFHLVVHEEVEAYRKVKLKPIEDEHKNVLRDINQSYEQIHYANSIVTGHLASVVKVHDAQNEILEKLDLKDLRTKVGKEVSDMSDKISDLIVKAKASESNLDEVISKFDNLTNINQ